MISYIVTFQTNSPESLNKVKEVIKGYGAYWPIHEYCWAVLTEEKATQIRDKVHEMLSTGERVFVVRSGTEAAWFNAYSSTSQFFCFQ